VRYFPQALRDTSRHFSSLSFFLSQPSFIRGSLNPWKQTRKLERTRFSQSWHTNFREIEAVKLDSSQCPTRVRIPITCRTCPRMDVTIMPILIEDKFASVFYINKQNNERKKLTRKLFSIFYMCVCVVYI